MRVVVLAFFGVWAGTALVASQLRWFGRPRMTARLSPYIAHPPAATRRVDTLSVESVRDVIAPLSRSIGDSLARALGITEDIGTRLRRVHSPTTASEFRVNQLGWSVMAMAGGGVVALAARPPILITALLLLGSPLLAFLAVEQRLASASAAWQRRVFLELPVIAEQLAMLLGAGYSLSAGLTRLAARGNGCAARDLGRVCARMRHGVGETEALREWATVAAVPAVDRLVPILALGREAADLGRLVSEEARSIRRDVHRELVETMERRNQQVWIPVTVATLVPGAVFLAVPFIEALNLFSGS